MTHPPTRLEVRNLDPELIRRYLREELGGQGDGETVTGEGWLVRFKPGEPATIGSLRVSVLFIEVEGPREPEVARFLRLKTMRGGG
jgi:hypothetical protein